MHSQPRLPSHIAALDCVRGIAILAVLGYHSLDASYGTTHLPYSGWWPDWQACSRSYLLFYPLSLGWVGVSLFFIASGFSIHYSARLRPDQHSPVAFVWKRFWRIVPAYLLTVAVFSRIGPWPTSPRTWQFWSHVTLFHDLDPRVFFGINPSYWSLAAEWHIYLLYPALILFRHSTVLFWPLLAISPLSQAVAGYAGLGSLASATLSNSILVNTAHWWLGAILAERFIVGRRLFGALWVLPLLLLWAFSTQFAPMTTYVKTTAAIACAAFTESLVWKDFAPGRIGRWIGFVGVISYSLYLWDQPVLIVAASRLNLHPAARLFALAAGLVPLIFLAWLSFRVIEQPGIKLGKWLSGR
jgi:peptidoglycan/LPS O-acetylase OafA/YrhL